MRRWGIGTAPDGCGEEGDGPCESCVTRAVRRGRWAALQLLPLTYRSRYHTLDGSEWFVVWRMWFGRVFALDRVKVA